MMDSLREQLKSPTAKLILGTLGISQVNVQPIAADKLKEIDPDRVDVHRAEGVMHGKPVRILIVAEKS